MSPEPDLYLFRGVAPKQFLQLAKEFSQAPGTCLFFSGSSFETAEKSFLWAFPFDALVVQNGTIARQTNAQTYLITAADVWKALQEEMQKPDPISCDAEWCGYLSYEMGAYCDKEQFASIYNSKSHLQIADASFSRTCFKAVLDHATLELAVTIDRKLMLMFPKQSHKECSALTRQKIEDILFTQNSEKPKKTFYFEVEKPFETASSFCQKVHKVQELIASGDVYQLNLSSDVILNGVCDPFSLFHEVVCKEEASFFSFLRLSSYSIVSASPERFLRRRDGVLESRPIKGTKPNQMQTRMQDLEASEKELSELSMIVDLIRNDMAKVSHPGSVKVQKFSIEEYKHLFHRHAVVQSRPKNIHAMEILKNVFPGGSITGCPKQAAMKYIYALEQRRRGIYTGAIGYISPNGDFDFSIAIRTAVLQGKTLSLAAGSGIVIDSDPISEYEEMLTKAKSMLDPLTIHGTIS